MIKEKKGYYIFCLVGLVFVFVNKFFVVFLVNSFFGVLFVLIFVFIIGLGKIGKLGWSFKFVINKLISFCVGKVDKYVFFCWMFFLV